MFDDIITDDDGVLKMRKFAYGDPIYTQAKQIWQILVGVIVGGRFVTDGWKPVTDGLITLVDVADLMGLNKPEKNAGLLYRQMRIIGAFCTYNDLPRLNSIVVTEGGYPPTEFKALPGLTVEQERIKVQETHWQDYEAPSPGNLRKVWEAIYR
jgi:hypothetical protein